MIDHPLATSRASLTSPTPRAPSGVWVYVAFTGIVFGGGGLLAKALIDDGVDAFALAWGPFLGAGALGLVVGARRGTLRRAALGSAVLLGLVASAVPAILFNVGFEKLPAGIVTLLISIGPVVTAVYAHFVFPDERFNRVKAVGLALALAGVGVLASGSVSGKGSVGAMMLVVVGSVIAGGSGVLTRTLVGRHGPHALIAPQLITAGGVALALSPILGRRLSPVGGFEAWQLLALIGSGVTTYLGFLSMLKANEIGTTGQVSVIGYCVPLFGVVGGIVLFDDPFTTALVIGGLLILVSVGVIAAGSARSAARVVEPSS